MPLTVLRGRDRLLLFAIVTSLSGKGVSVVTQLIAIPLAVGALGLERFGIYAMLTALLIWTNTASTVVGSALTLKIVEANARDDQDAQARMFSTAFYFVSGAAVLVLGGFNLFLGQVDLGVLFGLATRGHMLELVDAVQWMVWIASANIVLALAEATQAGYQKQYLNNLFLTAANIATIAGLVLVQNWPSIRNMALAIFLPATIGRMINLAALWFARPYLLPRWSLVSGSTLMSLLMIGAAFALMQVGSFIYQQFPIFYVGRYVGLAEAAHFSVMMQIIAISGSVLIMFTQPLLPALSDAAARQDWGWVRRSNRIAFTRLMGYVGLAAAAIVAFGSSFASLLLRQDVFLEPLLQMLWGLFFLIVAWEHLGYIFLAGLGRAWVATTLYVLGSVLMAFLTFCLVSTYALTGAFVAMCAGPLVFTVIAYPALIRRTLGQPVTEPVARR